MTEEEAVDTALNDPKFRIQQLKPLLLYYAHSVARNVVQRVEVRVRREGGLTRPEARKRLVGHEFDLPPVDGVRRTVRWELATAAEHDERARWQENRANEILNNADMHYEAARLIRSAGVVCLADLDQDIQPTPPDEYRTEIEEVA